jgi:nucleoside-diphosphate-sugar epimerase
MRILVAGATGQLGTEFLRVLGPTAKVIGLDLPVLDVTRAGGDDTNDQSKTRGLLTLYENGPRHPHSRGERGTMGML